MNSIDTSIGAHLLRAGGGGAFGGDLLLGGCLGGIDCFELGLDAFENFKAFFALGVDFLAMLDGEL